jgi:hypothetical protein
LHNPEQTIIIIFNRQFSKIDSATGKIVRPGPTAIIRIIDGLVVECLSERSYRHGHIDAYECVPHHYVGGGPPPVLIGFCIPVCGGIRILEVGEIDDECRFRGQLRRWLVLVVASLKYCKANDREQDENGRKKIKCTFFHSFLFISTTGTYHNNFISGVK